MTERAGVRARLAAAPAPLRLLAHPVTMVIVILAAPLFVPVALAPSPFVEFALVAAAGLVWLWHLTYLAAFAPAARPSPATRSLALAAFCVAILTAAVQLAPAGSSRLESVFGVVHALSWIVLIGLAGSSLATTFGRGARWRSALGAFVVVFAPISSIFYFSRMHQTHFIAPDPSTKFRDDPVLTPDQAAFWSRFRAGTGETAEGPRFVDAFGDSPALMDDLLALVLEGRKRATASLDRWYGEQTRPRPGDLTLVLDGRSAPACVIRTTAVRVGPVLSVTDEDAFEEGEGDRTRETWLADHRAFYRREAAREGFDYSDDLDVVFERFERIWPPQ